MSESCLHLETYPINDQQTHQQDNQTQLASSSVNVEGGTVYKSPPEA